LNAEIAVEMAAAAEESVATGKPARWFKDFNYRTLDSWSRERRVIGKAEWMTPQVHAAGSPLTNHKLRFAFLLRSQLKIRYDLISISTDW
jgi:hypothetical protein